MWWLGIDSFPMIVYCSLAVSVALTIDTLHELRKYNAADLSGSLISIGLLRDLAALIVSPAWCIRVSTLLSGEAALYDQSADDREFSRSFILPRFIAAFTAQIPLALYGAIIGFITGAFLSPLFGVSSPTAFLDSARQTVEDKDVIVYGIKLLVANPVLAIFAGCICGRLGSGSPVTAATNAAALTFMLIFTENMLVTMFAYWR